MQDTSLLQITEKLEAVYENSALNSELFQALCSVKIENIFKILLTENYGLTSQSKCLILKSLWIQKSIAWKTAEMCKNHCTNPPQMKQLYAEWPSTTLLVYDSGTLLTRQPI